MVKVAGMMSWSVEILKSALHVATRMFQWHLWMIEWHIQRVGGGNGTIELELRILGEVAKMVLQDFAPGSLTDPHSMRIPDNEELVALSMRQLYSN